MSAERWRRIEEIYHAALERAASEREPFLESACGGDETLRADVERLIAAQDGAGDFLIAPAWEVAASAIVAATTKEDRTMSLVGRHIATFEILAPLGVGGMGEVYRARDTKLNRDVAVKVLPELFALDDDRLARFRREAHVLASLNHPNIAAIYGFEEAPSTSSGQPAVHALVMELVEGPTLADRLARGRLPLDEALPIARQIADALEAAHERGIVHRDLKPANIKVRADGTVKVLDFGLAKVLEPPSIGADPSQSPTAKTPAATQAGFIIGTAAYMAPEQARGKSTDKRADMWAFGCVLYEMLTGIRAFSGDDVSETLAAVITREPDWRALAVETPAAIRRLLGRCLVKDPKGRVADASIARIEIDEALSGSPVDVSVEPTSSRRTERFIWTAALTLVTAAAVAAVTWALRPAPPAGEIRVEINTPPTTDTPSLAISPDGQKIVFVGTHQGQNKLWLRSLDADVAEPLTGTEGAIWPFWSPDSQTVAFFTMADNRLKRLDINGQSLEVLGTFPLGSGGTWNREGAILFSSFFGEQPISRISSTGGDVTAVTRLEPPEHTHQFPQFLPDGRHFLYHTLDGQPPGVYLAGLDGSERRRLFDSDSAAVYVSSGYLLFLRQGTLFAQGFDPVELRLIGNPFRVVDQVASAASGLALSVSDSGTIVYRVGPGDLSPSRPLVWFDRSGKEIGQVGVRTPGTRPSLSPDERQVAVVRSTAGPPDIQLLTLDREVLSRFTSNDTINLDPVWSPDGSQIAFAANLKGQLDLYRKPVTREGAEELLLATPQPKVPSDWSRDGFLLYGVFFEAKTGNDLWALPLNGDGKPFPVVQTNFDEVNGQFSPDGKWIAYQSNETGRFEIYVQPFPRGQKKIISTSGGAQVRWRRDASELFYIALDGRLTAVPIRIPPNSGNVEAGPPIPLFATRVGGAVQPPERQQYMVSRDGQRFLMSTVPEISPPIHMIRNWRPRPQS
jgi:eukaryotic-like serine/threonine-protein kinase